MKIIYKALCAILSILVIQGYRHYVKMQNHNRVIALGPIVQSSMSVKHLDPASQAQVYQEQRDTVFDALTYYDPSVSGYIKHCVKGIKLFCTLWCKSPVSTTMRLVTDIRWKAIFARG